jgi:prepilin-type N-terminal cleavage/methylation domain-containing protein
MHRLRRRCFTLIELMIVIAIVATMGSVLTLNITQAVKQQCFLSASKELLSRLQMTQDLMLMQRMNQTVKITHHTEPTPHIECNINNTDTTNRQRLQMAKKGIEATKNIKGIGDISFTEASGKTQRGNIELEFSATGNYLPEGVLHIYSESGQRGMEQSIVLPKHPGPLTLVAGNPTTQGNAHYASGHDHPAFPIEIYEKIKE